MAWMINDITWFDVDAIIHPRRNTDDGLANLCYWRIWNSQGGVKTRGRK